MLVLGRKAGQGVVFKTRDGTILVMVQKSQDGKVRLAIEAPKVVKVLRDELIDEQEGA
jgi:carbon storage regulator